MTERRQEGKNNGMRQRVSYNDDDGFAGDAQDGRNSHGDYVSSTYVYVQVVVVHNGRIFAELFF